MLRALPCIFLHGYFKEQVKDIKVILLGNNLEAAERRARERCNGVSHKIIILKPGESSKKHLLKKWLLERSSFCALYTDDLKYLNKRRLWVLFLCLGNAANSLILEDTNVTKVSRIRCLASNLFFLAVELFLGFFLWCCFVILLPAYNGIIKTKTRSKPKITDNRKMVYLRTNTWFGARFGGSVSHIKGFTDAMQLLGYDVEFISSDNLEGIRSRIHIFKPVSFFTHYAKLSKLAYNFTFFYYAAKLIRKIKPGFLYHRHDGLTFSSVLLSHFLRLPLILEFNSSEVWKKKYWGGSTSLWFYRKCEEIALHGADAIVTVSEANKLNLMNWYGIPGDRITVNPNGVDPDVFRHNEGIRNEYRRKLGLENKTAVGFTGSFGVWHGVEVLASIMPDVIEADHEIHFLWVGDGPYIKHVYENIKKYNLSENVSVVGPLSHNEIPGHLDACDILVSPHVPQADGKEFFGSPTKLFEYMAMGKGIVASNLGQIGLVIEHMKEGVLVEPGNKKELASAILKLSSDHILRESIGRNARSKVVKTYTWKDNARRVLSALDSLNNL
jgi:glycosyltransferase involved in cell wall biosynthesis